MKKYTIIGLKYQLGFDIWEWAPVKNYIEKVIKANYEVIESNTEYVSIEINTTPDKFDNIMMYKAWLYI